MLLPTWSRKEPRMCRRAIKLQPQRLSSDFGRVRIQILVTSQGCVASHEKSCAPWTQELSYSRMNQGAGSSAGGRQTRDRVQPVGRCAGLSTSGEMADACSRFLTARERRSYLTAHRGLLPTWLPYLSSLQAGTRGRPRSPRSRAGSQPTAPGRATACTVSLNV